jgi:hypothetical protein
MGKAPLRRIVSRTAVTFSPHLSVPEYKITYWIEVLECGHEQIVYSNVLGPCEPTAVRRRCQECLAIVGKKKPNQSAGKDSERRSA